MEAKFKRGYTVKIRSDHEDYPDYEAIVYSSRHDAESIYDNGMIYKLLINGQMSFGWREYSLSLVCSNEERGKKIINVWRRMAGLDLI